MNFNHVLEWVKSNLVIVIFIALMIAAPIGMYVVASGMNKGVQDEVNSRASKLSQLTSITVDLPDGRQVVPTEELLRTFESAAKTLADDASAVQAKALDFNRKGRTVLMPDVFPEPRFELREIIPKRFHERLVTAYEELLKTVRAGSPPELETLRTELENIRNRFISQDLKKDHSAALDPDESARLTKVLSDARIDMYTQAAGRIGMYASINDLMVPGWNQQRIPDAAEMFVWQWQYWAVEDVLKAIASANKNATSVVNAPVKHVLGVVVQGLPEVAETDPSSGGTSSRMNTGFGGEGASAAPPPADGGGGAAGAAMANPKAPITQNFSESLSGLVSQPLFDVLTIDFAIVVETARLPEVLDAISRYNFNTITNLIVESTDAFAATERGFYYGSEPVCTATIRMDTVWLREWTKAYMPPAIRAQLGIPADAPAMPAAPATP